VHQAAAHHAPAEMLPDGLMAETDAEERQARIGTGGDEVEADPRFVRRAGAGRCR